MGKRNLMDAWLDEASRLRPGQDDESIRLNERFWQRIPEPKLQQEVAFHVLAGLVAAHFRKGQTEEALEWSKLFDRFDFQADGRIDDGQKDLTIGRVYYALGDQNEAFRRWSAADRLSRGRCFQLPFAQGVRPIYREMAQRNQGQTSHQNSPPKAQKKSAAVAGPDSTELDVALRDRIAELSEAGNDQMDQGDFDGAIETFNAVLDLVPEPKNQHDAAGWLWASIGDAYFEKQDYQRASSYFGLAHGLAEMLDNAFVLLRLGQCALETGDEKKAADFLLRAYMVDGKKIFKDEKKYFDFLASKVDLGRGKKGSSKQPKRN